MQEGEGRNGDAMELPPKTSSLCKLSCERKGLKFKEAGNLFQMAWSWSGQH